MFEFGRDGGGYLVARLGVWAAHWMQVRGKQGCVVSRNDGRGAARAFLGEKRELK